MITNEMLETIENSTLADLIDALEIETDASTKEAIKNELKKRGIDNV